ncbi:MAG TPA: class I SAM-dependent methyltransferase [Solirubrobacterales bacterium]|jgi:SAM-dependent methyltransferase|nr:class I SAM-dependent methyltransferase [Solirubrobacterales bacterium]
MYEDSIREEFTHQAGSFGRAAVMTSAETLGALAELVPEDASARWLETACGTGLVSRALAGKVGSLTGVDLTPAMLKEAKRGAADEGIENVEFAVGDATALEFPDASFDGAVTRLSLHHIPLPGRVLAEMARVVRPGGWIVVGDLVADAADGEGAVWREEIERLRDPSHWVCRTPEALREIGSKLGLTLDREQPIPLDIDFGDWLARGSGGHAAAPLVDELLAQRPGGTESFRVTAGETGRRLKQRYWLARWRRPD